MPEPAASSDSSRPVRSCPCSLSSLMWVAAAVLVVGAGFLIAARGAATSGDEETAAAVEAPDSSSPSEADVDGTPARTPQNTRSRAENPFPNRFPAPSLDGGAEWLNARGEITLKDLRGKVVLLDFWTYCCINCIHVLPDLKFLERKYANELVVIGVHSAKFDNEKDSENIREAILRYEIEHPVVNDSEMKLWQKFGARSWPTLVLIDPEGHYCGYLSGEGNRELLDSVVSRVIDFHQAKGTLDRTPIRFDLERHSQQPTPLRYPGKVLADERSQRLFISDSNHNRIVIASFDGRLIDVVGSARLGADDGEFEKAAFDHPQGMALVGDVLYVADTENHLLRAVDLNQRTVATLAGTGAQARQRVPGGKLRTTPLNSPWDLVHVRGTLYIAMAGPHQIWKHRLGSESVEVYAGSGREDILDGRLAEAALAQPSGIVSDGEFLYVCDSEGSAIRRIPLDARGPVETVVGPSDLPQGRSLFEFGDVDGVGGRVRLQHPLGIVHHAGLLFIADTYNHKLKRIDLSKNEATSWLGDGTRGDELDPPRFSEPAGLALAAGRLYVADTNNHRICVVNLESKAVTQFDIAGLEPPRPAAASQEGRPDLEAEAIAVEEQAVAAGKDLTIEVDIRLPADFKLNTLYPHRYQLRTIDGPALISVDADDEQQRLEIDGQTARINVPLSGETGRSTLQLTLTWGFCREGVGGVCKVSRATWKIPLAVGVDENTSVIRLQTPDPSS